MLGKKNAPGLIFIVHLSPSCLCVCMFPVFICVCKREHKTEREAKCVCVCVSVVMSLVSLASPLQKKPVQSSVGGLQSPRSSARPLLMRTFSDESNTVI